MTASEIAKGLSKAQREALLYDGFWWKHSKGLCGAGSALAALARKGLVSDTPIRVITPLGLTVRAIIEQESRGE